jgi:hypothetical protein
VPVPTPILSVRVRPPLQWLSDATSTECWILPTAFWLAK